jgi:hypothetical protein
MLHQMKKNIFSHLIFLFVGHVMFAQVTLDSSNLPIVGIYTYLTPIPDTPKIHAFMGIVDNGYNVMNHFTDTNYAYYGHIGIEQRGSISQQWWYYQKSYGLETRDTSGNDSNSIILNMPKESDWILYSPYDDRTLMRNVITYELSRQMGYWAARTKYCELVLNDFLFWNYKGVYVMMEKIKRDNNRVDISKLDADDNAGDSLTGGYIFAVDSNINAPDEGFISPNQPGLFYAYKYPKGEDITPQQEAYLLAYVDSFEKAVAAPDFADPVNGYRKFAVDTTFMDFFFFQELSKSVDCYKRSAYLYKDKYSKGGRLKAGPVWDFNSAWHNTAICAEYHAYTGWAYQQSCWVNSAFPVPDWWARMLQDSTFTNELKCRWLKWRSGVLTTSNIFNKMDSIAGYVADAQVREYTQYNFTENFSAEIDTLKSWIANRLAWMDANMPGNCLNTSVAELNGIENAFNVYPNPFSGEFTIYNLRSARYELLVYNSFGEPVLYRESDRSQENISINVPAGIYFLVIKSQDMVFARKVVKTK